MDEDIQKQLEQLIESMKTSEHEPSGTARALRKALLEQGLPNAIQNSSCTIDDTERKRLLNQLDPEIFPL